MSKEARPAPAFSIIIPTYNGHARLPASLLALRSLDYPHSQFEVIVVDDDSRPPVSIPDQEDDIAIRVVRYPRNEGPAAARNRGASHARGACLVFLDDDCEPAPDWLRRLADSVAESGEAVVGGQIVGAHKEDDAFSEADATVTECVYGHYNSDYANARFLPSTNLAAPACLFRKLGGFNPKFRTSEDREFSEQCLTAGIRLVYAPDAVVVHRAETGFRAFWRRHYGYGRGAYRFRSWKASVEQQRLRLEPGRFYGRMLLAPFGGRPRARSLLVSALIAVSQIASAFGFLAEWCKVREEAS